ncbi:TonB-dependent receptor [Aggregatimonas sangjinii]|uniref:TonB-dependent receptor n=2 Tax=Aggregatimonas sangjinii TaxID=2583587 RepID=A0A5B7SZS6_9FLAO|nr:TonB-dependent receptor [Aggregatimonas sangjinii]
MQIANANSTSNYDIGMLSNPIQSTVTGTVTDESGTPLAGANVLVKGTTNGTQTDFDGNYAIEADSDATLIFSYIGFASLEVAVNGQSTVDVTMTEDAAALDEVVVTGYSTQTRGDITGSVASVDITEATKAPIVNAAEALQGRVSGVTVVNNGNPGAAPNINIRGFGTSNNTNPLYIIDGVQTDNPSVLNSINPNDISQMNVLKDGAAAIYGARASNGVIIITTKSGGYNQQKPTISLDMYSGFATATNVPKLLNAQQHGDMLFQSAYNDGVIGFSHPQYGSGRSAVVPSTLQGYTRVVSYDPIVRGPASATVTPGGTDWLDAILRTAPTQSASVSVSNGGETGKYFLSVGYLNRDGIQITTGFKQGVTRLNSEFKVGENGRLTVGEHLSASFSNTVGGNRINDAMRNSPLIPIFDDEGRFAGTGAAGGLSNARSSVAQLERGKDNFNKLFRVFGDVYAALELTDGLTVKTTLAGNIEAFNNRSFQALDPEHGEPLGTNTLREDTNNSYNWTWTNTISYANTFGEHNINALAGIESLSERNKGGAISRDGYLFETPDFYLLENGSGTPNVISAYDGSTTLFSIFGTANYNYAGKYFLTGTLRNDTSSRFLGDNKSETFPSLSAGWLISNENFFPQDGFINRLKLKGSWGNLGNQTLPASNPTININALSEGFANYAIDGAAISTGAILRDVGNPDLKWETSVATNVGFELGMLDNSLSLEFEYFDIKTKDLITRDNSLISTTAIDAAAPLVNLGTVENTGFDLSLGYNKSLESGLSFGITANISKYENEVTELISDFQAGASFRPGILTRTSVGRPISSFFGLEVTGFDDNGRFTYADLDGSGDVSEGDRDFIGSPHPDFTYGLNLNVAFKGIDLSAFFNGSQGNDIYNYEKIFSDFPTFVDGNRSVRVLDSWTPTNTDASLPALSLGGTGETQPSSFFVEDGSFFRLKNLQVGYTVPSSVTEKIGLDMLRFYISGTNIFTITDYDGFDPEVVTLINGVTSNLTIGVDSNVYPQSRILSLGVNLKL